MTVKLAVNRRIAGIAAVSALAVTLAACGGGRGGEETTAPAGTGGAGTTAAPETTDGADETDAREAGSDLSGNLAGAGASSMEKAQNAWMAEFMGINPDVIVSYDPGGSGAGRTQFVEGTVQYAGSDSAMSAEEIEAGMARCGGSEVIELPLYLSPIAVGFNLSGIDSVNLSPDTLAGIFTGEITNWNDPAIAADNEDLELPDLQIIPVNRSDKSGTTDNFTDYLEKAAPSVWTYEASDVWPLEGTQAGAQTSGVKQILSSTEGAIGYLDASQADGLGTVAVGVGDEFVAYSPEAAARVLEVSELTEDSTDFRLTYSLARDTTESGTYPIVLVAYTIACEQYENAEDAELVKSYLTYVASEEGQAVAARPDVAGIAPLSDSVRELVMNAVDQISAG
nr:phosphate ABC transporter substrate-binding protein PstS [Actinomycetales bacterium]